MNYTPELKRVTLWVRDLERSIAFYRDVIGLAVLEQKDLQGPAIASLVGYETGRMRIAHLGTPGTSGGWVGLYELTETVPPLETVPAPPRQRVAHGQVTVVFESTEIEAAIRRLKQAACRLLREPSEYVIPARGDRPAIRLLEVLVFDPDDVLVSIMGSSPPVE